MAGLLATRAEWHQHYHASEYRLSLRFLRRLYRQVAPNPYASLKREEPHIHLFGMPGFDPAQSYGTALASVPDVDALYQTFAAGLRAAYG